MPYNKVEELPQDVQERLPLHAQQIFVAGFNAAQRDGMSEAGATEVAWSSVKNEYEVGSDGKWRRKPDDPAIHHKAVMSGGN